MRVDTYSTSAQFRGADGREWWLTGVYGPQSDAEKIQFLRELRDICAACPGPWAIASDFNLIYRSEDKNNDNLDKAMMGRFWKLLNDLELKEVHLLGRRYT